MKALQLIKKHGSIEEMLKELDAEKYQVPEDWPFKEARGALSRTSRSSTPTAWNSWTSPDEEGVVAFLVGEKQFSEDRVSEHVQEAQSRQGEGEPKPLETFFGAATVKSSTTASARRRRRGRGEERIRGGEEVKGRDQEEVVTRAQRASRRMRDGKTTVFVF